MTEILCPRIDFVRELENVASRLVWTVTVASPEHQRGRHGATNQTGGWVVCANQSGAEE